MPGDLRKSVRATKQGMNPGFPAIAAQGDFGADAIIYELDALAVEDRTGEKSIDVALGTEPIIQEIRKAGIVPKPLAL